MAQEQQDPEGSEDRFFPSKEIEEPVSPPGGRSSAAERRVGARRVLTARLSTRQATMTAMAMTIVHALTILEMPHSPVIPNFCANHSRGKPPKQLGSL